MKLSRRQLRHLLQHGEVTFGEDGLRSIASMAEQIEKQLAKVYESANVKKISELLWRNSEYKFTKFEGCFRKAMDKLGEARYWLDRVALNARQGK